MEHIIKMRELELRGRLTAVPININTASKALSLVACSGSCIILFKKLIALAFMDKKS